MKTISSDKSLILFEQNRSTSNIHHINDGVGTKFLLKENYFNVFNTLVEELKTKQYMSFVKLWHKVCDKECNAVRTKLRDLILHDYEDAESDINKVVMKFRGNLGEIFAEAFFTNNLSQFVDGSSYEPVDPTNERFIDAISTSTVDGLPIGIQVKNYNAELVHKETFDKAAAEDCYWLRVDKKIKFEDVATYLSSPHQVIFSFTDTQELFKESHAAVIIFLGPWYIDSVNLQGNVKMKIPARWQLFKKIADEIEQVH